MQVAAVAQIAVMEFQAWRLSLFTELVRILVKMIDPGGVETAGSALDAMYDITFLQQKLSEVAAVWPGSR